MKKVKIVDKNGNIIIPEISVKELGRLLRRVAYKVAEDQEVTYDFGGDNIPVVSTEELERQVGKTSKQLIDTQDYITPDQEERKAAKQKKIDIIFLVFWILIFIFIILTL